MKVLLVNKFHYVVGGSETYYFSLKRLLEKKGHTVIEFSMKDDRNVESEYEKYFVSNVNYNSNMTFIQKIKAAINIIYSNEAKERFEKLILDTHPDIIHLNLFQHQISPSILDVINKYNIPTVYTAHDLKMICPNYKMLVNNRICEDCKNGKYWNCFSNKCVKSSFSKSLINTIEAYYHDYRKSYDAISYIITPSDFYREKLIEFGIEKNRVVHIPNFIDRDCPDVKKTEDSKKYYLYLGRMSEEKGIMTLIKAIQNTKDLLYIVGKGPMYEEINKYIKDNKLSNIVLKGFLSGEELLSVTANSKAVVLPSEWYENGPYSAIEALQLGRPIIGARIGGIPELINENGYLFNSGNIADLQNKIENMNKLTNDEYHAMEIKSKELFEKSYTEESHYNKLIKVYNDAISINKIDNNY